MQFCDQFQVKLIIWISLIGLGEEYIFKWILAQNICYGCMKSQFLRKLQPLMIELDLPHKLTNQSWPHWRWGVGGGGALNWFYMPTTSLLPPMQVQTTKIRLVHIGALYLISDTSQWNT